MKALLNFGPLVIALLAAFALSVPRATDGSFAVGGQEQGGCTTVTTTADGECGVIAGLACPDSKFSCIGCRRTDIWKEYKCVDGTDACPSAGCTEGQHNANTDGDCVAERCPE